MALSVTQHYLSCKR